MRTKTQAEHAFDRVRTDILACRLAPGARLRINDLGDAHEVSLGAMREALSRLQAEGLVVAEPQKGFTVSPVSERDLIDLTEARVAIEGLCLEAAVTEGDVDWESRIVAAFHRLSRLPERNPDGTNSLSHRWSEAHSEFHEALVAGCANTWLLRMRSLLYARSERYRHLSVPLRTIERAVDEEHRNIMEATLARDASRAKAFMAEHLRLTSRILLELLEGSEHLTVATA